jgi:Flp pilus assembly pilin Flp
MQKAGAMTALKRFICDEQAATAVEYAIVLALLIMAMIGAVRNCGTQFNATFNASTTVL